MPKYATTDIRNIALVGHNNSGKTSLADMVLFKAKAVPRAGRVEEGTSVFDTEVEEKERKSTINMSMAFCEFEGKCINILDTPGYADFIGQTISALAAAETAVLCINAFAGIMVNTRKVWEEIKKTNLARIIMVTKVDQDNVDLPKLVEEIRETFGRECVPFNIPDATGGKLTRVVDLLRDKGNAPADLASMADEALEKIVECDDALLEKYLSGEPVATDEILKVLPKALAAAKVVPILFSSVTKDVGVSEFLGFVVRSLPSPAERVRTLVAGGQDKEFRVTSDGPFACQVIKAIADPFVRKIAYLKIMSGVMQAGQPLQNPKLKKPVPIGALYKPFGKEQKNVGDAVAGDVVCVTKVEEAKISETFNDAAFQGHFKEIAFPTPMISLAVEPKAKADETKLVPAIEKMADSDPTFKVERSRQTGELVITGVSQLHLDLTLAKMKRVYEVQAQTRIPKIPFKETITVAAQGHHKHKKQTGGHGQYGECYIRLEPNERGKGFEFIDEIVGGKIPGQYVPSIEKGIRRILERGILAGCEIVDVKVAVYDGSYHEVDSSNESFEIAGYQAFLDGFMKAKPVLLEPIVKMSVYVPAKNFGDVNQQLISKRGLILGADSMGTMQVIHCQIPLMEIMQYSSELSSITGGEGYYTLEPSHYEPMPSKIAEGIIARARAAREEAQK